MDPIIEEQLKTLRKYYQTDEDVLILDDAEKKIRESIKKMNVANTSVFQEMTVASEKAVEDINFILINQETLSEKERGDLIAKRKVHQFYLDRFTGNYYKKRAEAISSFLEVRVKAIGDNKG